MFASLSRVVFIFVVFAKLNCGAADICAAPPPMIDPHECCDYPCPFDKSTLDGCGVKPPNEGASEIPSCEELECMFKKENVMTEDKKINVEGGKAMMSKWLANHAEFMLTSDDVANRCLTDALSQSGPPDMCLAKKVILCFSKTLLLSCPASLWTPSDQCENAKAHLQQCFKH